MPKSELPKGLNLTCVDGILHIRLKKHMPLVIYAEDKYPRGTEFDICSTCDLMKMVFFDKQGKKKCYECFITEYEHGL